MLRYALISQIVQMLIMELSILQISYSPKDVRCKISVPNPANSVRNS